MFQIRTATPLSPAQCQHSRRLKSGDKLKLRATHSLIGSFDAQRYHKKRTYVAWVTFEPESAYVRLKTLLINKQK